MDDHVHVLVQPQPEHNLASIEHSWKSYSANRLQREHGWQGQVWQDESYDRIVRDEDELHQKAYYILTNPQRRWMKDVDYKWVYLNQQWPEWERKSGQAGTPVPLEPENVAASQPQPVFSDAEKKRIRQLGKMTILRSNGTSLYQTKELGLAKYKFDWVKEQTGRDLDESLYVVGAEQKLYFEQVFAILRLWGFPNADKCKHIAYELVVLPEGKMSSREGTVVSYRELRDAAIKQAEDVIREKGIIQDEAQIRQTARDVAIAAIKYTMLQVSGNQQIVFDFAQALSFDGRAAPYLQYAYARAGKLVAEAKQPSEVQGPQSAEQAGIAQTEADLGQRTSDRSTGADREDGTAGGLHPSEIALARLLSQFPETCRTAAEKYEPAVLCNYLYAIADAFSAFYRDCRVLDAAEPEKGFRQGLTRAFRYVLKTGFKILALPLPEAM
jgi:arginyl-tRNA synthetase